MTPITKKTLEDFGFIRDNHLSDQIKEHYPNYESYYYPGRRFTIGVSIWGNNLTGDKGWTLHIDNSDMESIANCDVEFIEQIETLMTIYKNY